MNKKSYSFDLDTFRNMLQICLKLPGQHFVDTPFKEDILAFMRELGYSETIKLFSDVKVDLLPQPWRTFSTIINKCLSDLVYQIENKEFRKNKYLYYPRFTKVIINHFMSQDQSIPRRNKVDWHMANDDSILTTMRFIPQHEVVLKYGAILPDYLTTQAMKESEAYKTYHALATGKLQPKPKYVRRSSRTKTDDVPKPSSGKRVKATTKVAKSGKKKQPAIGLDTLSDIALTEVEQLKLATKRSLTQTHISQPSGSGTHEGTGVKPGIPDVPTYCSDDDEEIPWKSSDEDDNDDNEDDDDDQGVPDDDQGDDKDSERTVSDTKGDDFVHPKFTSHDTEERHDEESSDLRVQTPSHYEPLDDEANDDLPQSGYAKEEEVNVEQTFEANINLEGRDAEMTDAPKTTQVIEDTHENLTPVNPEGQQQSSYVSYGFISNMLNPNPDTGIDFVLNVETTLLVDVPVTSQATTTLPQPSNPLIPHRLEVDFLEFKETNQYATALSSIPNIVDTYLGSKLKESVDVAIQLKSDRLCEEAQTENESFLNNLDVTMQTIIKEQVNARVKKEVSKILPRIEKLVNEQPESEVLIRSSHEAKSTHSIIANLSELELKKILIDKMESNKSIGRSDEQKNLYKALVNAYVADKDLLDAYGDTVTIKRRRDEEDDDQEPSDRTDRGSKRRRAGKEPESSSAPKEMTTKSTGKSTEGSKSRHQSAGQSAPTKEPIHSEDAFEDPHIRSSKQEPMTINLKMKSIHLLIGFRNPKEFLLQIVIGTRLYLLIMEYVRDESAQEVYKATTEQLDWTNPEGQQYPHDLRKPLPLISNTRGRQVIPFDHFFNNDLAYLSGGVSSQKNATSVTKAKAADYGNIKWIEDLVPNLIWREVPVSYDKYALWGISHWGRKPQHFYGYAAKRESAKDVYSRQRIIAITKLQIIEWHGYKHLDWITIRRDYDKLYSFKEGDLKRLRLQDIEDILILLVQGKLSNLKIEERLAFSVALQMFTRTYSSPRGFIYQNKDKKNRLMRLDELHKFSDGTLDDVRTALDDRLKGIRMEYLPKTI
ncbi:hypothetical protein Tco_0688318 [Tanacetum coccineum]